MKSNSSDSAPSTQLKRVVDIAWRRKWWVIVPVLLATATSLVLVGITPKAYRATTTILVTRQGVPDEIVRSSVTLRIEERMRSLELQIFSRSYLEQVAREFKLVPADAGDAEIETACLKLRARVVPELDRQSFSWFRISVEDIDPERAAGIANRLAGLFIEENSRLRASQATGTREATESWEQKYRLELDKRDEEISTFKKQNLHELPDQQPANEQLLQDAQNNVASLTTVLQSANDRLVTLRGERDGERAIPVAPGLPDAAAEGEAGHLATLQRELEGLRTGYTDENPLVKRKRAQIAELVRSLPGDVVAGTAEDPAVAARLDSSSVQIAAVENEIGALERDRAREIARVYAFRARIRNAPRLQPKILELARDSDQAKRELDIAVVQNERAQHLQDLEESKTGDQLQIQDRAIPPAAPFRPNVFDYLVIGFIFGIVIGVGAAAGREFVDQSVRSEDAFAVLFPDLAVYGVIPRLDVGLKPKRRLA
jgi:succinoglycan biosynthesis transport protein ExoP